MPNTTYDFWLMVQQNTKQYLNTISKTANIMLRHQKIVMLTDIIENDESKCAIYFPQNVGKSLYFINSSIIQPREEKLFLKQLEEFYSVEKNWNVNNTDGIKNAKQFNYFCIRNLGVTMRNGYSIRKLHCLYRSYVEKYTDNVTDDVSEMNIQNKTVPELKQFIVYHYWFKNWPDHRSPENIDVVLDMCLDVLDSDCVKCFDSDDDADEKNHSDCFEGSTVENPIVQETYIPIDVVSNTSQSVGRTQQKKMENLSANGPLPIIHW